MSLSQSFSQKIGNVRPLNPCPSLDIDFANGGYVTDLGFADQASVGSANFNIGAFNGPDPIFTRATAATFRGSNGLIQYAPENLLSYSEQFNDASWSKSNVTVSANSLIAPDGALTSDKLVETAISNSHILQKSITSISGGVYTLSVYAKASERSWCILQLDSAFTGSPYAYFDLANGVVGNTSGSPSAKIISVGSGWYRCTISAVGSGSSGTVNIFVSSGNGVVTYLGDITKGIYIWGAQLERSSTVRPYISTTALPVYGPRFEYDLSGNPLGLLMEEQSQNLLQYSEQFDNAYWSTIGINRTGMSNATTSPSGLQDADQLVETAGTTQHVVYTSSAVNRTSGATYCYSVFVKPINSLQRKYVILANGVSSNHIAAVFDLTGSGSVSHTSSAGTGVLANSFISQQPNGWYRCSIVGSIASATAYANLGISNVATPSIAADGSYSFPGVVGYGIYIWGAQLEQKPFATSYMPTVGGPMTRNADVVNSTIGSWFNQTDGTIVVTGDRGHSPSLNASLYDSFYEFSDGGGGYHSAHFSDGTSEEFFGDNGAYATSAAGIATIGTFTSIASSYSSNDIYTTRDGVVPNSAASATFVTTPTTLNIGYSQALTQAWNGHIKSFRYFPKALPNNLQRLSS